MNPLSPTWICDDLSDPRLLDEIPSGLARLLISRNGWILQNGLLHVRGAVTNPTWHSLRHVWQAEGSLSKLYPAIRSTDLPFAQDAFGDQFLLRDGGVFVLSAETGEIAGKESSLDAFFQNIEKDPVGYLNGSENLQLLPGQLLFAFPPFFVKQAPGKRSALKPCPAEEVIEIHADIARQIKELPDGARIEFKVR